MENLRALVVEDDNVQRIIAVKLLRISSFQVIADVNSGNSALEFLGLIGENEPKLDVDLILSDYCMPGITGYQLLQTLKNSPLKNFPVVIMSADGGEARKTECLEGGAFMYFAKPLKMSDVAMLKQAIVEKRGAGPSEG